MLIETGKIYVNKTWKYLRPCLKDLGPIFRTKFNGLFKLATGIHDCALDGTDFENFDLIYILFDSKYRSREFKSFLDWARNQDFYVTDYQHDTVKDPRQRMVVVKPPEKYEHAYQEFLQGRYSKMYHLEEVKQLIKGNTELQMQARDVLLKTDAAREEFVKKVNKSFGTKVQVSETMDWELDFHIEKQKEFFNYEGD